MHRGYQAIQIYLHKHGYGAIYMKNDTIKVGKTIIKPRMRDAIEFLLARNAFKKRKV